MTNKERAALKDFRKKLIEDEEDRLLNHTNRDLIKMYYDEVRQYTDNTLGPREPRPNYKTHTYRGVNTPLGSREPNEKQDPYVQTIPLGSREPKAQRSNQAKENVLIFPEDDELNYKIALMYFTEKLNAYIKGLDDALKMR